MSSATANQQQWWENQSNCRRLLATFCLLISREPNPVFQWNGESGEVHVLNPDGTQHYEMVPPPKDVFRQTLSEIRTELGLTLDNEISWTIPFEKDSVVVQIRVEKHDSFPHLTCRVTNTGNRDEVNRRLKTLFEVDGVCSFHSDPNSARVRGSVVDQDGNPVAGVRLSDRASNWNTEEMDKVTGPDDPNYGIVVLTDEQGRFDLKVGPSIYSSDDQSEGTIRYRPPNAKNWLQHVFKLDDVRANPHVKITIDQVGSLNVEFDFSDSDQDDRFELVVISKTGVNGRFFQQTTIEKTDSQTINGLVPGTYFVSIGKNDAHYSRQFVEVVSGKTSSIRFKDGMKKRNASIELIIEDANLLDDHAVSTTIFSESFSCWEHSNLWLNHEIDTSEWAIQTDGTAKAEVSIPPFVGGMYGLRVCVWRTDESDSAWHEDDSVALYRPFEVAGEQSQFSGFKNQIEFGANKSLQLEFKVANLIDCPEARKEIGNWWSQQPYQLQMLAKLLLHAAKINAKHIMFDGFVFYAHPDAKADPDNSGGFSCKLGAVRFDNTVRDLNLIGIPDQNSTWSIPVGDQEISVNIGFEERTHEVILHIELEHDSAKESIEAMLADGPADIHLRLVRGQVIDHLGEPVAGAKVMDSEDWTLTSYPEIMKTSSSGGESISDADGRFELLILTDAFDEAWTERELFINSSQLQNWTSRINSDSTVGTVNNVVIQLPQPASIEVDFDFKQGDLEWPFRLFYSSPEIADHCDTIIVDLNTKTKLSGLAPGIYYFAVGRLGQQIERQRVELAPGETKAVRFTSPPKLSLHGKIVCSGPLDDNETIDVFVHDQIGSPWTVTHWYEPDETFEDQSLSIKPGDLNEDAEGNWIFEFPIHYLIGGRYEIRFSVNRVSKLANESRRFESFGRDRCIEIEGPSVAFEPIGFEMQLPNQRDLQFILE